MKINGWKRLYAVLLLGCAAGIASPAQTFKTLTSFNYTDGAIPFGLVQGTDGNFYGTTDKGGNGGNLNCNKSCGSVFKMSAAGKLTTVHAFNGGDGNGPSGLMQAINGTFYGTTTYGGTNNCVSYGSNGPCGTVFAMTFAGVLTPLYNFCAKTNCTDGAIPWGTLVQATNGNFYGTTVAGGTGSCAGDVGPGCGTIFEITAKGVLSTLYSFSGSDGSYPYGGLVQATNGNFYGTTSAGGPNGFGTVFEITAKGSLTTLHSFDGSDGGYTYSGLVQASNGNFYGTTSSNALTGGGPNCTGSGIGFGTVFEITAKGTLTTLHNFANTDGAYPYAGLVQATDGNFYGTTGCGGSGDAGTIFKIIPKGTLTTLHSFVNTDGTFPYAGLIQSTSGTFYGTAVLGGTDNDGTVWSLSEGLVAFVETRPTSGKVGTSVIILGSNLTGATSVTFNGTAAKFTVVSGTEIKTTVPSGATTGTVAVTTSSGTLKSNVVFQVTP
jgi:uncharacterized repeat protein (TIGR03803 family)